MVVRKSTCYSSVLMLVIWYRDKCTSSNKTTYPDKLKIGWVCFLLNCHSEKPPLGLWYCSWTVQSKCKWEKSNPNKHVSAPLSVHIIYHIFLIISIVLTKMSHKEMIFYIPVHIVTYLSNCLSVKINIEMTIWQYSLMYGKIK